ncbi:surface antigen-domain-containing protein [Russula earlei]|uniref:Surface antigen-domain-containing protein n=1 Tax=Russula earlei TaxID=71964 RepID=A0ACC0TU80_9AGAM|nr:surface antigen-domain-containing protein [Russula earlei]
MNNSLNFMKAYLNSQGYYSAILKDSIHKDTVSKRAHGFFWQVWNSTWRSIWNIRKPNPRLDQYRTNTFMTIDVGKNITIDSVSYNLVDSMHNSPKDSAIQQLTLQQEKNSLLKKGKPYTKQVVGSELDRLITLYHQNGYFRITKDDIYALVDTVDTKLLELSLDPGEQAKLVIEAEQKHRENPTWDISVRQRDYIDSFKLHQYHIGNLYFYPELTEAELRDLEQRGYYGVDSLGWRSNFKERSFRETYMRYRQEKYKLKPLREHSYLKRGDLYNEDYYYKSLNSLGQIGTWSTVDGVKVARSNDTVDIYFYMIPEKKQIVSANLEGSYNTGDIIASSNLFGISGNVSYRNRNVWKRAVQSVTNFRLGVELSANRSQNNSLLQTFQAGVDHSYIFPGLLIPRFTDLLPGKQARSDARKKWRSISNALDNKKSIATISASYTDRKTYYQLRSLTTSWGYEASIGKPSSNVTFLVKLPNVELYKIDTLQGLDSLFKVNPFLRNSFRNGNVVSFNASATWSINSPRHPNTNHLLRLGIEWSGFFNGLSHDLDKEIFNYQKIEAEYRLVHNFKKSQFALRFISGIGLPKAGETMPVFKQYSMGGPYSMRGWGLRQLGLGSSILTDTSTSGYTDRFGDFEMELDMEYRFNLATIGGVKIASAFFTDMGNVWNIRNYQGDEASVFRPARLGKDLAIAAGTGLRLDFSYFLIRVDFGYKVKDPARQHDGGWMSFRNFEWTDTRQNGVRISNYAFQFGIGLPF